MSKRRYSTDPVILCKLDGKKVALNGRVSTWDDEEFIFNSGEDRHVLNLDKWSITNLMGVWFCTELDVD